MTATAVNIIVGINMNTAETALVPKNEIVAIHPLQRKQKNKDQTRARTL